MATLIKTRLQHLCNQDESLKTLWAQWTFDEQLISKALNNIGQIFPHYSLHDASHSNQIVTNIERILGEENINLLSATDLWLILESAFCHDIGMVLSMETVRKDWSEKEFQIHLESISLDSQHELNSIAKRFIGCDCTELFSSSQWPLDVMENIRLILSDYYRKQHASRADSIINNPWNELNLSSPRNELLPSRLFKILGKISSHHGLSFRDVMKLPKKEVGIGNDNAHPRYVACLLRLGDLLDLDDNRFCPVMMKTAGRLPISTHAHIDKHMSIEHFRMDSNRIEVYSICDSYEGYRATVEWFNYIEKEINSQMMHWDDIVPTKAMGLLPTIGDLDAQLKGYELLSNKQPPNFQIDKDKMLELLQGSGVYDKPIQCIREILQNAVDATLLKVWCDKSILGKYEEVDFEKPTKELKNLLKDYYPITVTIDELNSKSSSITWKISIQDNGIGIDKEQLTFLQNIGSSNKNYDKRRLVKTMPKWLRPSGAFGIGFQSIFLITDKVSITSKGLYSGQAIRVEMNNPLKEKLGNIFIRTLDNSYMHNTGTCLEIELTSDRIPKNFTYYHTDQLTTQEIKNYDFVEEKPLNVEILSIINEIKKFAQNNYIPININFSGDRFSLPTLSFVDDDFHYFEDMRIGIHKIEDDSYFSNDSYPINLLFKGQPVESHFSIRFAKITVDLLGYDASTTLEINRNKIKSTASEKVTDDIVDHFMKFLNLKCESFLKKDKDFVNSLNITFSDCDIENLKIPNLELGSKSIVDILGGEKLTLKEKKYIQIHSSFNKERQLVKVDEENGSYTIVYLEHTTDETMKFILDSLSFRLFKGLSLEVSGEEDDEIGRFVMTKVTLHRNDLKFEVDEKTLLSLLIKKSKGLQRWPRLTFFCTQKYIDLAVNDDSIGFSEALWRVSHHLKLPKIPQMVLPIKHGDLSFKPYNLDRLVEWTFNNRVNGNVTKERIYQLYQEYLSDLNEISHKHSDILS